MWPKAQARIDPFIVHDTLFVEVIWLFGVNHLIEEEEIENEKTSQTHVEHEIEKTELEPAL